MAHWMLVSPRLAQAVGEAGGQLYVWTVDDAERIASLEALGVDGVITNDPRLFELAGLETRQIALDVPGGSPPSTPLMPVRVKIELRLATFQRLAPGGPLHTGRVPVSRRATCVRCSARHWNSTTAAHQVAASGRRGHEVEGVAGLARRVARRSRRDCHGDTPPGTSSHGLGLAAVPLD